MTTVLRLGALLLFAGCTASSSGALYAKELAAQLRATGMREPVTVVSVVGDAYWPSATPDGRAVVFTASEGGSVDVWKKVLATGELVRLTDHSAEDEDPAVSPDGKRVAFISRRDDAKGDVFVMRIDGSDLRRVTHEQAAERAPAWAPDGRSLFVSVRPSADALEDIYRIAVDGGASERITEGGGFDASAHPSGTVIVYAQPSKDPAGVTTTRIVARRLSDGKTIPIGDGRRPEAFPRFVRDASGRDWIYFTRYVEDDKQDGRIDTEDLPALYRAPFSLDQLDRMEEPGAGIEPLTSGFSGETLASAAAEQLFFVGSGPGGLEIQALPLDGSSQKNASTQALLELADSDLPGRMRRYFLRVVQARGGPEGLKARYEIARDFAAEGRLEDAQNAFDRVVEIAGPETPIGRLARLEQLRNQFFMTMTASAHEARTMLEHLRERAQELAPAGASNLVRVRAHVITAEAAAASGAYEKSLGELAAIGPDVQSVPEDAARVSLVAASASSLALPAELEQSRLIALIRQHPRQVREVKAAKQRILELLPEDLRERLAVLSRLLPLTQGLPTIRMPLSLEEAEALSKLSERRLAITKLEALRKEASLGPADLGRTLFALGTIQEGAGDFAASIDTFEQLALGERFNRVQRDRGKGALLRLALKKARADEARGELAQAFFAYRTLARNNPNEPGTHRKVLELGDKLGKARALEEEYHAAAVGMPFDRVAQYAAGLAATYTGDLSRAKKRFAKALELDSSMAFAHLGLGWVHEQEEYRAPGTSDALEKAVYEYSTARSLFEGARNHDATAEAALNLGNAFARLGQFDLAFEQYLTRETSGVPFQNATQEIIFRERFGQAAFRAGEHDVALMSLKDGIRLAEREGDERRLGRMRALLALCYDTAGLGDLALRTLIRARDEYATNGDFNRVIALDRTIGWLSLQNGDLGEATAALERAHKKLLEGFGPRGFKFGVTFRPLGIVIANGVDPLDTSRAPFGFSRDDEQELLQMLLARVFARIGDTEAAAEYQERRLALLAEKLEGDKLASFILPDYLMATAEMMRLALRRDDVARAASTFVEAAQRFAAAETRAAAWMLPHLEIASRMPLARLGEKASVAFFAAAAEIEKSVGAAPQDGETHADPGAEALVVLIQRVRAVNDSLEREKETTGEVPEVASKAAAALPMLFERLTRSATATATPREGHEGEAATRPAATTRAAVLARVAELLDSAEAQLLAGGEGEKALVEAEALAEAAGIWDAGWQADYVRFRVGPEEGRAVALARAAQRLPLADAYARLIFPTRPRGALWQSLMDALVHDALSRKDAALAARHLERRSALESFVLPPGLERPDLTGAEASRKALEGWARVARDLVASANRESVEPKTLRAHLEAGKTLIVEAAEPWKSLLACDPDPKEIAAALEPGESFDWMIARQPLRLRLEGARFVLVDRTAPFSPSSQPASAPAREAHYVAGPSDDGHALRVASASALVWHDRARNVHRQPPLDVGHGNVAERLEGATPPDAVLLRAGAASKDALGAQGIARSVIRFVLAARPLEAAPGVVHFALAGETTLDAQLSSLELPRMGLSANVVVIDGLPRLDERLAGDTSRALALAGTPTTLLCAPDDVSAHARLLGTFYRRHREVSALDAWREASRESPAAAGRCQLWGLANDGAAERIRFAEQRLKTLEGLASAAHKQRRLEPAKALYEMALDLVEFLNPSERDEALAKKKLIFIATLAQLYAQLGDFDPAIAFQQRVIAAFAKTHDAKSEAAAYMLLGQIQYIAGKHNEAAVTLAEAARRFETLSLNAQHALAKQRQGIALVAAVAYTEAAAAYAAAAEAFGREKNVGQQLASLRGVGVVYEQNLSEFEEALRVYSTMRDLADRAADKENRTRTRIDLARIHRQLANYEEALKSIREVLSLLEPSEALTKSEALLELARIRWYANDYDQALAIQGQALALASDHRKLDERRADFLRIQAQSLEGLILLSQGKRIAASNRLRRALRLARITRRKSEESSQLNNFGFALRERGLLASAELVFGKAIAIDTELKSKDGLAFDFRNLGLVLLRQGKLQAARQYLAQAQELNRTIGNRYNQMQIQLGIGELALAEKRLPEARAAFEAVIAEAARLKSRDTEWRARLGSALARTEPADAAYARAELERALAIVEALGPKLEEAQSDEEKINALKLSALHATLADAYARSGDTAGSWSLFERLRLKELRDQVPPEVWSKRLSVPSDDASDYTKLSAAAEQNGEGELQPLFSLAPAAVDELAKALPGWTVVHARAFASGLGAVIITQGKLRSVQVPLARADAARMVRVWLSSIEALQPPPAEAAPLFDALSRIFDDAALAGGKLLVIGDGLLSRVPWASVPLRGKHLIERAEVHVELSAAHALVALREPRHTTLEDVLAVGPVASDGLPYAELETRESVALFGELRKPARFSTLEAFTQGAPPQASFWHIALHGDSRGKSLQGAFLQSGSHATLHATTLLETRRRVPLVLLSACHRPGSAPNSLELVTALKLSGSQRVIAAQSRVYDDYGALFVKRVISRLAQAPETDALRIEQLAAIARGEPAAAWGTWLWFGR